MSDLFHLNDVVHWEHERRLGTGKSNERDLGYDDGIANSFEDDMSRVTIQLSGVGYDELVIDFSGRFVQAHTIESHRPW